jgi:hypothetical protein
MAEYASVIAVLQMCPLVRIKCMYDAGASKEGALKEGVSEPNAVETRGL